MIAAVTWVRKGVSKSIPAVAELPSKEEIEEIIKTGALTTRGDSASEDDDNDDDGDQVMEVGDAKQTDKVSHALAVAGALGRTSESSKSQTNLVDIVDGLKELDMDHYDDEDEDIELFSSGLGDLYYPSNEMDPYLNDKDDCDSEELEDMTIQPKDSVIVCARNEDEFSHLEVWILEESGDGDPNMYVLRDIVLSALPLCTAWLDCLLKGGEEGNFIAVGCMDPAIEIWDLDIINEVQPSLILGGIVEKKKEKGKGKKMSGKYKEGSHTGAVLGLAWSKQRRNILASASADKQVKIWDVAAGKCIDNMEHHTDKVQAVAWNHCEPQALLSGSFDRSVVLIDSRTPAQPGLKWLVAADVESLAWDPRNSQSFVVSLEDGMVQGFDIRVAKSASTSNLRPSFTLHAHDKAVSTICYNHSMPNLLATGSMDKTVKLWDLSNNQPSCIASRNLKAGAVFSISFSEDDPFLLAVGGSKGKLQLWDTSSDSGISRRLGNSNKASRPDREI